jgi:hypothetical protein
MKAGTENRNKTVAAGVLGACALIGVVYMLYTVFGGSSAPTPPSTIVPVARTMGSTSAALSESGSSSRAGASNAGARPAAMPTGNAAGVAAKKMATSSASLDPTLDQSAMLRTEHLVYAGSGRNIFSAIYTPPVAIPTPVAPARKNAPPPTPVFHGPVGPPPPPPINLKFFGTATRANGVRQAFLLQGEDVFLASQGDIVARKYRIVSISANSVQVEDMANNNTQTLPLQSN